MEDALHFHPDPGGDLGVILVLSQYKASWQDAYQLLVDAAIILYFIPFLYMYASAIKLAYRADRTRGQGFLCRAAKWEYGSRAFWDFQ